MTPFQEWWNSICSDDKLLADPVELACRSFYAGQSSRPEEGTIDLEAIAWALKKLQAFGVGTATMDSAMMLDRLTAMLVAPV